MTSCSERAVDLQTGGLPYMLVGIMALSTQELNSTKGEVNMRARRLLQQLLFMSRPARPKGPIFT